MVDECRPPAGTPAGTVCELRCENIKRNATWMEDYWLLYGFPLTLGGVARSGWRFVRVVENAHD